MKLEGEAATAFKTINKSVARLNELLTIKNK